MILVEMETFLLGLVDLHNNKLTGPIPPQIGRLKRLKVLIVCIIISYQCFQILYPNHLLSCNPLET
ncbi:hypothetical protein Bca52824_070690 [Brassica carinata]|uniref:Uncharacterized protein n=1 Tax=Brassica carinata TaxID=52824 RepID=A0A8X7U435_BRACI|nr:hypothetical protein Bca52824_070690 [Brassica carinata]